MTADTTGPHSVIAQPYIAISEISVPEAGIEGLERAFTQRLRAVDDWPGFQGLELLQDRRVAGRYLMIETSFEFRDPPVPFNRRTGRTCIQGKRLRPEQHTRAGHDR